MTTASPDPRIQIVRNIRSFVERWNAVRVVQLPPLVHVAIGLQESSLNPDAVGDNGQSPGLFQIYQPVHPNTDQLAVSPWADYAYYLIRGPWETAWQQTYGDYYWPTIANRGSFLERFAPLAQGSIAWPAGTGAQRYQEAVALWEAAS